MQFFKKKYPWYVKESMENIKFFDAELERLHKLYRMDDGTNHTDKQEIFDRIVVFQNHILTVSQRIAGIEYNENAG